MAVLPLRHLPDPILRQKAKRVRRVDASLQRLIDDMIETMQAESGVGLAANQVGVLHRLAVIQLPEDEEARVLINPEITHREDEREVGEGCLSIPGYRGLLKRAVIVRAKATDRTASRCASRRRGCWPRPWSTRPITSTVPFTSTILKTTRTSARWSRRMSWPTPPRASVMMSS